MNRMATVNQVNFQSVTPSFAHVVQAQTSVVAQQFNRTLKYHGIDSGTLRNVDMVRAAVIEFRERYNHRGRLEKPGFTTLRETRQINVIKMSARVEKPCPDNTNQ